MISSTPRPINPRQRDPVPIVQEADWVPGPVLLMEAVCTCGQLLPACNMHVVITQQMLILISIKHVNPRQIYLVTCYVRF